MGNQLRFLTGIEPGYSRQSVGANRTGPEPREDSAEHLSSRPHDQKYLRPPRPAASEDVSVDFSDRASVGLSDRASVPSTVPNLIRLPVKGYRDTPRL